MKRRRAHDDRGVTLIVVALCLTLLVTLVAFAVDLGQQRFGRRDTQQLADLASLAAGRSLAGHGGPIGATALKNPYAACTDAIGSVQTNAADFRPLLTAAEIADQCAIFHNPYGSNQPGVTVCSATSVPRQIDPRIQRGPYSLTIRYPIPAAELTDAAFGGPGLNDGVNQCERMRIDIRRVDDTAFAGVIGIDELATHASAVVRGGPVTTGTGVATVLLLERTSCPGLYTSGQGRLLVESPAPSNPGVIGVDSAGVCPAQDNQNGFTIYAPSESPNVGGPRIVAQSSSDGTGGVIASYAMSVGGRAGCCYPAGLSVDVTPLPSPTSRRPADDRFNPTMTDPVRPTIRSRHASGYATSVSSGASPLVGAGAIVTGCDPASHPEAQTALRVTVDCPAGLNIANNTTLSLDAALEVKFIGSVSVAGSLVLPVAETVTIARPTPTEKGQLTVTGVASFDEVRELTIGGTPDSCTQGGDNCRPIAVSGTLLVNTGSSSTTTCSGSRGDYASVATFGGTISITGRVAMCDTTVYVGTSTTSYAPQWVVAGGNCSVEKPCHVAAITDARDRFLLSGGGSAIEWTAPDLTNDPPNAASPFESLALWAEGSGLSQIKGTGQMNASGVFFLPNALFDLGGQGTGDNPRNAQFFARRLEFSGQGLFRFRPDPSDAVPTAIPGGYALIR